MERFSNLPGPVKGGLLVGGGGGLLAAGVVLGTGDWMLLVIPLIFLVVLAGGYLLWMAWRRKKQNARLGGELQQHTTVSPRGISDPGQRARLDDMRKKFEQGVSEYRSRGKDLYTLPWYVIVGEPGSGKTEAVRHSNVGFPPGMQDEFQGVGGTINMNWWFTNQAVLLDTAGRLMFEEVQPGETSEWKEFLNLLKKNRPNCPINGLFLIIPSDSLIRDSADAIAQKAGKIARQLDVIQRTLDVRFPVFVVVTKCDKINGFREFFDGLTDPQLQHQIMGWTNPDPLDAPFRPDLVDQHLESVAERLRRRRLGLLRDPISEQPEGRRTDEVDSLYALPHSLSLLATRLRRYLETVFVAGEWSAKPLFLRGIFFTSSMREGAALDEELANAIGVQVDELPEGKVWERERAYFLRDLFLEKVFREKGLVTRATNTTSMLRRRQVALLGTMGAGLLIFVAIAWLGGRAIRGNVTTQSDYWYAVSNAGWVAQNNLWKPSLIPYSPKTGYANYATNTPIKVAKEEFKLDEFHKRLQELADKRLEPIWYLPRLARDYNRDSQKAQQVVFENGVIKPLVEASRLKMEWNLAADPTARAHLPAALAALIQLEAEVLARENGLSNPALSPAEARSFLTSLLDFATDPAANADQAGGQSMITNLVTAMVGTYSVQRQSQGTNWPPLWADGSKGSNGGLEANPALRAGLDAFIAGTTNHAQIAFDSWNNTGALFKSFDAYRSAEESLFQAAHQGQADPFKQAYDRLNAARQALEQEKARMSKLPFLEGQPFVSLTNAYFRFTNYVRADAIQALDPVQRANHAAYLRTTNQLFLDIQKELASLAAWPGARLQSFQNSNLAEKLEAYDAYFAAKPGYAERWDFYRKAYEDAVAATPFAGKKLIGQNGESLRGFLRDHVYALTNLMAQYKGGQETWFQAIGRYEAGLAEATQRQAFLKAYMAEVDGAVNQKAGFPLFKKSKDVMDLPRFVAMQTELNEVRGDLASEVFRDPQIEANSEWNRFRAPLTNMIHVANALLDANKRPVNCSIYLLKDEQSLFNTTDKWRQAFRRIVLNKNPERDTYNDPVGDLGSVKVDQGFTLTISDRDRVLKFDFTAPTWGPLWLLHQPTARAQTAAKPDGTPDGTTWLVEWPVKPVANNYEGAMRLKLVFDEPLPSLANWPSP
jgi:IcmF-related N-terminal domain